MKFPKYTRSVRKFERYINPLASVYHLLINEDTLQNYDSNSSEVRLTGSLEIASSSNPSTDRLRSEEGSKCTTLSPI